MHVLDVDIVVDGVMPYDLGRRNIVCVRHDMWVGHRMDVDDRGMQIRHWSDHVVWVHDDDLRQTCGRAENCHRGEGGTE